MDDGAKDFETSYAMAKASAADGVTNVVCTPHANGRYQYDPAVNKAKVAELQARLDSEGVNLSIGLGCDFHMTYDNVMEAKTNPAKFSINGLGYLMVEIPDYGLPPALTETFYELQLSGLTPVLTHPERNPTLQSDSKRMEDWLRGGMLIQVTGDSVTGKMGKRAQKLALELLDKRWVHFLATDAHNVSSRPPRLSEARAFVAKKYGSEYADSLVTTNPKAAFEGKPIQPVEEPLKLYEEYSSPPWWKRLFS